MKLLSGEATWGAPQAAGISASSEDQDGRTHAGLGESDKQLRYSDEGILFAETVLGA